MVWFRRSLILLHRYLGIALSLLFVVWFATGITMMYRGRNAAPDAADASRAHAWPRSRGDSAKSRRSAESGGPGYHTWAGDAANRPRPTGDRFASSAGPIRCSPTPVIC